jgi:hypothetical protein
MGRPDSWFRRVEFRETRDIGRLLVSLVLYARLSVDFQRRDTPADG